MRRLLIILILTFSIQSLTKADDIKDFEIEGISIGDSALDLFNRKEIKEYSSVPPNLTNTSYSQSCFENYGDIYDRICVAYNKNSKKKIIEMVQAQIIFEKDVMPICRKKQYEVDNDLSTIFKDLERADWGKKKLKGIEDLDLDAYYYPITYDFIDESRIQIACYSILNKSILKVAVYNLKFGIVLRK